MTERRSLLVVAHGFTREGEHPAHDHAARLRHADVFDEVSAAFVNDEPSVREQIESMQADRLVVVPLFVSGGHFVGSVVPEQVEAACPAGVAVDYARPVGTHERTTDVVMRRALAAVDAEDVGIALVGHGSEHRSENSEAIREHARRIRDRGPFTDVRSYFVEEEPTAERVPDDFAAAQVVVVPVFVASGTHVREDIPEQVGDSGRGGRVGGTTITYVDPVGTDPLVAGITFERATAALDAVTDTTLTDATGAIRTHERRQEQ